MSAEDAWESLRSLVVNGTLSSSCSVEDDGKKLKLGDTMFEMKTMLTVTSQDGAKSITYSLGSLYTHLCNPDQTYMQYRGACKRAGISDLMKVLDRTWIGEYFSSSGNQEVDTTEKDTSTEIKNKEEDAMEVDEGDHESDKEKGAQEEGTLRSKKASTAKVKVESPSKKQREHRRHHKKDKRQSSSSKDKKTSSSKGPITNEDLFANLETVVGKRSAREDSSSHAQEISTIKNTMTLTDELNQKSSSMAPTTDPQSSISNKSPVATYEEIQKRKIKEYLSSAGYGVTKISKQILNNDRAEVEKIMSNEIPVGNSASILRPTHHKRDFLQVLELYQQVLKEEERKKRAPKTHTSSDTHKRKRPETHSGGNTNKRKEEMGKPIIIVPNTMTSPITLVNVEEFLGNGKYVTRQEMLKRSVGMKRQQSVIIKRNIASRLGGGLMEYEIIDNPKTRLAKDRDWDRVVAVIGQGAAWQFKGWKYANPVDIFSKTFGFYIGMEGAPVPKDITSWNVKREVLSRDKRGMDRITFASFWNRYVLTIKC